MLIVRFFFSLCTFFVLQPVLGANCGCGELQRDVGEKIKRIRSNKKWRKKNVEAGVTKGNQIEMWIHRVRLVRAKDATKRPDNNILNTLKETPSSFAFFSA